MVRVVSREGRMTAADRVALATFGATLILGPGLLRWHNADDTMIGSPLFWPVISVLAVSECWLLWRWK